MNFKQKPICESNMQQALGFALRSVCVFIVHKWSWWPCPGCFCQSLCQRYETAVPDFTTYSPDGLNRIVVWSIKHELPINEKKSFVIRYSKRITKFNVNYYINGEPLAVCDQIRDLGVIFDSKLTFTKHIDNTEDRTARATNLSLRDQTLQRAQFTKVNAQNLPGIYPAHYGLLLFGTKILLFELTNSII